MFGFPFVTSLIATMVLVVVFSLIINKGMASKVKKKAGLSFVNTKDLKASYQA
jgi:hypothetical protein